MYLTLERALCRTTGVSGREILDIHQGKEPVVAITWLLPSGSVVGLS